MTDHAYLEVRCHSRPKARHRGAAQSRAAKAGRGVAKVGVQSGEEKRGTSSVAKAGAERPRCERGVALE
jgi:hypothetical protein